MKLSIELRVKVKSLADEARTIRTEERRVRGADRWNLQHHRKTVVRDAARRSLIAYQHVRGRDPAPNASSSYAVMISDVRHVRRMVEKYGDDDAMARLPALEEKMKARQFA